MEKLQKEAEINRLTNVVMKEKNDELEKKTEQLEQSYNNISVLSRIGKDITATLDLDTILTTVYENVNELMDATIFGIGIYKPEEASIEYRLAIEKGKRYQPYRRSMSDKRQLAVWCIENNGKSLLMTLARNIQDM
jgi:nitrate/nitrite-specific signal transduction histidine kinase